MNGESQAAQLFVLLFSMAGPMKMIPAFAASIGAAPRSQFVPLAIKVALFGLLGFVLAVFIGVGVMNSWGVSREALGAGAGLVLLLSALAPMLNPPQQGAKASPGAELPPAVSIAFPTMIAPNAMGIVMLFAAFLPGKTLEIIVIGATLMAINAVCMIFSRQLLGLIGAGTLQVLGAVFGILQLSLGIEMIFWALRASFN